MKRRTELYRHYDKDGALLYVGISINALQRLSGHKRKSSWFGQVAKITIEHFATAVEAELAERKAIRKENPIHNRMRYPVKRPKRKAVKVIAKPKLKVMELHDHPPKLPYLFSKASKAVDDAIAEIGLAEFERQLAAFGAKP